MENFVDTILVRPGSTINQIDLTFEKSYVLKKIGTNYFEWQNQKLLILFLCRNCTIKRAQLLTILVTYCWYLDVLEYVSNGT